MQLRCSLWLFLGLLRVLFALHLLNVGVHSSSSSFSSHCLSLSLHLSGVACSLSLSHCLLSLVSFSLTHSRTKKREGEKEKVKRGIPIFKKQSRIERLFWHPKLLCCPYKRDGDRLEIRFEGKSDVLGTNHRQTIFILERIGDHSAKSVSKLILN